MDSTTVAWHAARFRAEASLDPLAAYTLDYRRFPDADEREFVESALTAIPCRHAWLDADQSYPLGDWPDTFAHLDEPPPTFGAVGMSGVLEAAAAGGATGVMTGHGADHILIASPTQRLELLARGELLSDTLAFRRRHGSLPPLMPVLGQAARIAVLRHAPGLLALRRNPPQLDLLQRDHVANSGLLDDLRREGEQYGRDTGRRRAVRDTGSQRQQRRSEHLDLLGRRAGVEFLNPFLDRRVIEVAASLPGEMIFARGETKVALRRTMEGRLPGEVIGKRIPTARGGPYAFGLGANGGPDIVRRLLADPALARIGVVDAAKLRQAHERFLAGDGSQLTRIASAVGGEIWLRRETGEPLPD